MTIAYIGLGSNLGDRRASIDAALSALASLGRVRRVSRLRETAPWGRADQPAFLNAVAEIDTTLTPGALLEGLQRIERDGGRARDAADRWGPRTIDLDLLLYGDLSLRTDRLTVPHPRLSDRRFVLEPLCDLAPDLVPPGDARPVARILETLPSE